MGSGLYSGTLGQTCEGLEVPISLKKIQELSSYGVGFGIDGRGELCTAVMILGIRAVSCLFRFLNSAMGSKSLIWMNDVLIEMGIRERMMFLWSLSFCWIFLVDIEGLNVEWLSPMARWGLKTGRATTHALPGKQAQGLSKGQGGIRCRTCSTHHPTKP